MVEEEERVAGMEEELDGVQKQIAAHKADDQRRERRRREEAKAASKEQDAEMRGWAEGRWEDSAGEFGVSIEWFGRAFSVWALPLWVTSTWTGLIEVLRNLPDLDRDKCQPQNSEVTHPNLMHALCRPPRKTRTNSRVGGWRRSGKIFPGKEILEGLGGAGRSKEFTEAF